MRNLVRSAFLLTLVPLSLVSGVVRASDDLLWLEEPRGERALEWARITTEQTKETLGAFPSQPVIAKELASLLKATPSEPDQYLVGTRAIRVFRDAAHPYGQLQVAPINKDRTEGWKTVLDMGQLRKQENSPLELQVFGFGSNCLAPEYDRCLLRLSPGGGDEVEIREFDLSTGAFVKDGFRVERSRAFAEWLGPDQVVVGHTLNEGARAKSGWPATFRLWKRGQRLEDAKVIYQALPTDSLVQTSIAGTGQDRVVVLNRAITYSTFEALIVNNQGEVMPLALPRALKAFGVLATSTRFIFVQLAEAAVIDGKSLPAEAILAYDIDQSTPQEKRVSVVYTPGEGEYLDLMLGGLAPAHSQMLIVVNRNLKQSVRAASFDQKSGWSSQEILEMPAGETITLRADQIDEGRVVAAVSGFLTPRSQYVLHANGDRELLAQDPALIDATQFKTEIGSAISKDGTSIDYFLLTPRLAKRQPVPMLMTGYGAFGLSVRPGYFDGFVGGPSLKLWLDRGGALALPVIRGGGERGEPWHQAAIREKRQNSYDDFIAVAEHLVSTGVAAPGRVGMFGSSNGGLLAAVLGTQRPDLFKALVSDAPVTDMIRYPHMGIGGGMLSEFGDPSDPVMAKAILGYSPFQNVRKGIKYSPFLVTISTEDNRVGPGHARKFSHRLQDVGAPVYFYEEEEGGHGVSDALSNPKLMTLRMAFLVDTLMGTP